MFIRWSRLASYKFEELILLWILYSSRDFFSWVYLLLKAESLIVSVFVDSKTSICHISCWRGTILYQWDVIWQLTQRASLWEYVVSTTHHRKLHTGKKWLDCVAIFCVHLQRRDINPLCVCWISLCCRNMLFEKNMYIVIACLENLKPPQKTCQHKQLLLLIDVRLAGLCIRISRHRYMPMPINWMSHIHEFQSSFTNHCFCSCSYVR